jgi:hypothetical protein
VNVFPVFNEEGDLPIGVYKATLQEVVNHFGSNSLRGIVEVITND